MPLICFAHGKESGPAGRKIMALSRVAHDLGYETIAPDFTSTFDPEVRLKMLLSLYENNTAPDILVGSSMGGALVLAASQKLKPKALFLMAPAVGLPGYEQIELRPYAENTVIVHGWDDDIVPVDNVFRFARENRAELHILDDGHALTSKLGDVVCLFRSFLDPSA